MGRHGCGGGSHCRGGHSCSFGGGLRCDRPVRRIGLRTQRGHCLVDRVELRRNGQQISRVGWDVHLCKESAQCGQCVHGGLGCLVCLHCCRRPLCFWFFVFFPCDAGGDLEWSDRTSNAGLDGTSRNPGGCGGDDDAVDRPTVAKSAKRRGVCEFWQSLGFYHFDPGWILGMDPGNTLGCLDEIDPVF